MPFDPTDILRDAAARWYHQHLGQHLHPDRRLAVQRCASHLITEWAAEPVRARDMALQVLGTLESSGAYIDVDRTTSSVVFLVDPVRNRRVALTATDLARIAQLVAECGGMLDMAPPLGTDSADIAAC